MKFTLKPSSPGFSGSKSYNATQHGCDGCGGFAGERMGDGNGEAAKEWQTFQHTNSFKLTFSSEFTQKHINYHNNLRL